ncbi:MAG: hypothetical protein AAB391_01205 [Patescibacteria group bacterium]
MSDKKTRCEELYKEYLELDQKTRIIVGNYVSGKKMTPQHIDPEELLKREELRMQLLDCRGVLDLSDDQLFELENG